MSRIDFRVFVCSTFEDFRAERSMLQAVFSRLSGYCESRGAQFQAVDLRWGISEEASREQRTLALCLQEIARCKAVSPRVNFICLLGNRYGWRPLPAEIPAADVDALPFDESERALLDRYYPLDCNAIEPTRVLVRLEENDAEWDATQDRLRRIFTSSTAASAAGPRCEWLERSATHTEIMQGVFANASAPEHALVLERCLDTSGAAKESLQRYFDLEPANKFRTPAAQALAELKSELAVTLGPRFRRLGASLVADEPDARYLMALADTVEEDLRASIDEVIAARDRSLRVDVENSTHERFATNRVANFHGRETELEQLARFATEPAVLAPALLVTGAGGSGKSALLAKLAQHLVGREGTVVVQRYMGAAAVASQPAALFSGIMATIRAQLSLSGNGATQEYLADASAFAEFLAALGSDRTVAILIDGIEHLRLDRPLDLLGWLPQKLPAHVRLVVAGRDSPVLQVLRQVYGAVLEVTLGTFTALDAMTCIESVLADRGRRLSKPMRAQVQERVANGALPLEASLLAEQLTRTRSFEPCPSLGHDLDSSIDAIIDRIVDPREHLLPFSQLAMRLLTVASDGVSEHEMQAVLALDESVVAEFTRTAHHPWDVSLGLPSILWSRLLDDLSPYLMEREGEGQVRLTFFHQEFPTRVRARLMVSSQSEARTHALLADHFDQPLEPDAYRLVAAGNSLLTRRVRVLATHLWESNRIARWSEVIQDFSFLMARCAARLPETLLNDLPPQSQTPAAADDMVTFLRTTVSQLGTSAAWPAYRMLLQRAMEQPNQHSARRNAEQWLDSGACDWTWLCNVRSDSGSQSLTRTRFAHHAGGVIGMVAGPNGTLLSWSGDGVLRLCDIETGTEIYSSEVHTDPVRDALMDGDRIITWSEGQLCASRYATGVRIDEYPIANLNLMRVARLPDGEFVALHRDGSLQRRSLADGSTGSVLSIEPPMKSRHVHMQHVDVRVSGHNQVLRWQGGELALWELSCDELVTAFTLSYASFRMGTTAAGIITADATMAGDLLVADDCGRLFRCAADRSSIELLWGGDSPHYWVEHPNNGGATPLDDGQLLLWQSFFGHSQGGQTCIERAWSIWHVAAGTLVSEGRTSSEGLTTDTIDFMDVLTPTYMHHYPLMHLSGAQFIGCHGKILTLVDLDAGTEKVLRRFATVQSHFFCGIVDRRTIAFVDRTDGYLLRVDSNSAYLLAQGQGAITCGIAAGDDRYVIGMTGGQLLDVDLATTARALLPQSSDASKPNAPLSYLNAVLLPGGRAAAVDPRASSDEVMIVDLDSGCAIRVLQTQAIALEARSSDDLLRVMSQVETGRRLTQAHRGTRDAMVVGGMLLTLGTDGLQIWNCATYERIFFADLSAQLGCRQVIALWQLSPDRLVLADPSMEPPQGELLILVMSWMGDVYLVRPIKQKSIAVFHGRGHNSELGHADNRRMKLFEERWLLCWHGFAPPEMFDLHAVIATETAEPTIIFRDVADHLPLDAEVRELFNEKQAHHLAVNRKTFAEVQDVVAFGGNTLAFVRNGGDVLVFDRTGTKLGAFPGDRLVRLDEHRAAAWLSGQRGLRADGRYRVHALPGCETLAQSPRHPTAIESVRPAGGDPRASELLSRTATHRYFHWQLGTENFHSQGRVLDALEDPRMDATDSETTALTRIDDHCWSAWGVGESIVLSQATTPGRRTVALWRGDEELTVHGVDASGVVVATTLSGRLLILQLRRGAERISLADCAGMDDESCMRLHSAAARQKAAWLRNAAILALRFSHPDIADILLAQAATILTQSGATVPVVDSMWATHARLLQAWKTGDTEAILSRSTEACDAIDAALTDGRASEQQTLLWIDALGSYCLASAAAGDIGTTFEEIKALASIDPSVGTKPPEDLAALLITIADSMRNRGWVTSARAALVMQQAKLAASRAIADALNAGPCPELVIQELHNLVNAAGHARDLPVARKALDELKSCLEHTSAGPSAPEAATARQRLKMLAVFRAQALADIAAPDEARSAFGDAEQQLRDAAPSSGDDRGQLSVTKNFYCSWLAFESSQHEPKRMCALATIVCEWLIRRTQPAATLADTSLDELELASSVADPLLATKDDDLDLHSLQQKSFSLAVLEPVTTALASRQQWQADATALAVRVNAARHAIVSKTDQEQGLQIRRAALRLHVQAHLAKQPQGRFIEQTSYDVFAQLLEQVDAKAAHEFAQPVVGFLRAQGLDGDIDAARALHGMMSKITDLLESKQLTSDARAVGCSLAILLREIIDNQPATDLRQQWAQAAARSIGLAYRDLGAEQGAGLASHWQQLAFADVQAKLQKDRVGNWLQIVLANIRCMSS